MAVNIPSFFFFPYFFFNFKDLLPNISCSRRAPPMLGARRRRSLLSISLLALRGTGSNERLGRRIQLSTTFRSKECSIFSYVARHVLTTQSLQYPRGSGAERAQPVGFPTPTPRHRCPFSFLSVAFCL